MKKATISEIVIRRMLDEDPDTSWLGKYVTRWEPGAIRRHNRGQRECEYFVPAIPYEEHWKSLRKLGYSKGESDRLARQYIYEDFRRMEALCRGDWYFMGIRAECTVQCPAGPGWSRLQTFTSYGLWGIESDAGQEHIGEIEQDQLVDLKQHLQQFNVSTRNFGKLAAAAAVKEL